jgi:hypothetical protein
MARVVRIDGTGQQHTGERELRGSWHPALSDGLLWAGATGSPGDRPGSVRHWTNLADESDVVALAKDLRPLFGERGGWQVVHNGARARFLIAAAVTSVAAHPEAERAERVPERSFVPSTSLRSAPPSQPVPRAN